MCSSDLAARRKEALSRIDSAATHILSLVEDTLDIARVEAGALHVNPEAVPLATLVDEVVSLLAPLAAQRDASIDQRVSASSSVRADRVRLRQVLINVLGNAVRYGGNSVHIVIDAVNEPEHVTLRVADSGPGINEEMMQRLFVPFERLGAKGNLDGGAGLGMMLARNLVDLMGGTLTVSSTVGSGTTVSVALPRA